MTRKFLSGFLAVAAVFLSAAGAALAEDQGRQDLTAQGVEGSEAQEALPAAAQRGNRQPTADEMREMMQGVMGPMMGEMMSSMLKSMTKTMAEPQIAQNMATFARNYYQALIERGFSEEEALKIVTSTGVPSLGGKS